MAKREEQKSSERRAAARLLKGDSHPHLIKKKKDFCSYPPILQRKVKRILVREGICEDSGVEGAPFLLIQLDSKDRKKHFVFKGKENI